MSVGTGLGPANIGGLTDEQLVNLARSGHEPAFDAIVHRYRAPLVSYCRRWVDPHRAEEVVQHTLMKAFLCLRDDTRPLALRPWLYRVAHNAALNALEKKGSDWDELDENYDGVPQPPQVAEQRARFLSVVGEIEALPDRQREALLLNEFEGRCYAEIASELGTSESGVRGLLRRARRQLRDAAAVLLPFPALREFVRSDSGRSFQADRAGEIIGTAGAAGGLGAAGGFAKVAAGVLAAGTIAGGGTALEHRQPAFDAPPATVQGLSEAAPAELSSAAASPKRPSPHAPDAPGTPALATSLALNSASVASGGSWSGAAAPEREAGRLESVQSDPQSGEETPVGVEVPKAPKPPLVVPDSGDGEKPQPDEQKPEGEGTSDQPTSKDPPAGGGQQPAEETKQEEPSSTPSTDGPIPPISS